MNNRTAISDIRNQLQDLKSDLRGIELRIIPLAAEGDVRRASDHLQSAIGLLTDALTYPVGRTAAEAMAAQ